MDIEPDDNYFGAGDATPSQSNVVGDQAIAADPGNVGGLVPSYLKTHPQKGVTPQKHFVSPKSQAAAPGDFLAFKSGLPAGMTKSFHWFAGNNAQAILPAGGDAIQDALIKRDQAAHVPLQLVANNASGANTASADTMNVWVVWADGHPVAAKGNPAGTLPQGDFRPAIGYARKGTKSVGVRFAASSTPTDYNTGCVFEFTIQPPELVQTANNADVPDLTGDYDRRYPPPLSGTLNPVNHPDYVRGVKQKWDTSQSVRTEIINPGVILDDLPQEEKTSFWSQEPEASIASDIIIQVFPGPVVDPLGSAGNDDVAVYIAEHNPYQKVTDASLAVLNHEQGSVRSADLPGLSLLSYALLANGEASNDYYANEGNVFIVDERFAAFLRVQIGSKWYRVSNHVNWHFKLNTILSGGV